LPQAAAEHYDARMRVLGVDVGARRIGLAVSDPSGTLARPLRTLELRRGADMAEAVTELIRVINDEFARHGEALDLIVIGYPRRLDGTPHDQTAQVEAFVSAVRERLSVPIALQDERLSSHEAEGRLAVSHRDWRERKKRLDAAAAAVILQDYLDHGR
jgi:putative Holliday junction resolvase